MVYSIGDPVRVLTADDLKNGFEIKEASTGDAITDCIFTFNVHSPSDLPSPFYFTGTQLEIFRNNLNDAKFENGSTTQAEKDYQI